MGQDAAHDCMIMSERLGNGSVTLVVGGWIRWCFLYKLVGDRGGFGGGTVIHRFRHSSKLFDSGVRAWSPVLDDKLEVGVRLQSSEYIIDSPKFLLNSS